tara:strand:- start:3140 stop:16354 length:13215 start_codon:yes stop_codon:yes gene_type:complete
MPLDNIFNRGSGRPKGAAAWKPSQLTSPAAREAVGADAIRADERRIAQDQSDQQDRQVKKKARRQERRQDRRENKVEEQKQAGILAQKTSNAVFEKHARNIGRSHAKDEFGNFQWDQDDATYKAGKDAERADRQTKLQTEWEAEKKQTKARADNVLKINHARTKLQFDRLEYDEDDINKAREKSATSRGELVDGLYSDIEEHINKAYADDEVVRDEKLLEFRNNNVDEDVLNSFRDKRPDLFLPYDTANQVVTKGDANKPKADEYRQQLEAIENEQHNIGGASPEAVLRKSENLTAQYQKLEESNKSLNEQAESLDTGYEASIAKLEEQERALITNGLPPKELSAAKLSLLDQKLSVEGEYRRNKEDISDAQARLKWDSANYTSERETFQKLAAPQAPTTDESPAASETVPGKGSVTPSNSPEGPPAPLTRHGMTLRDEATEESPIIARFERDEERGRVIVVEDFSRIDSIVADPTRQRGQREAIYVEPSVLGQYFQIEGRPRKSDAEVTDDLWKIDEKFFNALEAIKAAPDAETMDALRENLSKWGDSIIEEAVNDFSAGSISLDQLNATTRAAGSPQSGIEHFRKIHELGAKADEATELMTERMKESNASEEKFSGKKFAKGVKKVVVDYNVPGMVVAGARAMKAAFDPEYKERLGKIHSEDQAAKFAVEEAERDEAFIEAKADVKEDFDSILRELEIPDELADEIRVRSAIAGFSNREQGAFETMNKFANNPAAIIPFIASAHEIEGMMPMMALSARAGRAEAEGREFTLTDTEEKMVKAYLNMGQREMTRWSKVADLTAHSLPFMGEIAATAGVGAAAKKATMATMKAGLEKLLSGSTRALLAKKVASDAAESTALKWTAVTAQKAIAGTIGAAAQAPIGGAGRIAERTMREMYMPALDGLAEAESIEKWLATPGKDFGHALSIAGFDNLAEYVSEFSGGGFNRLGSLLKLSPNVVNKLAKASWVKAARRINKGITGSQMGKFLNRAAYSNPFSEMLEERLGEGLRAAGHVASDGYVGEEYKMPTMDQMLTEMIAFSIPGGAAFALNETNMLVQHRSITKGWDKVDKFTSELLTGDSVALADKINSLAPNSPVTAESIDRATELFGEAASQTSNELDQEREIYEKLYNKARSEGDSQTMRELGALIQSIEGSRGPRVLKEIGDTAQLADDVDEAMAGVEGRLQTAREFSDVEAENMELLEQQEIQRAIVAIKVGRGEAVLTEAEQAQLNAPLPDGSPAVEMVGDVPIITEAARTAIIARFPAAEAALKMTAAEAKKKFSVPNESESGTDGSTTPTDSTKGDKAPQNEQGSEDAPGSSDSDSPGTENAAGGFWSAQTQKGNIIQIPATEAKDAVEAVEKMKGQLEEGDTIDEGTLKVPRAQPEATEEEAAPPQSSEGRRQELVNNVLTVVSGFGPKVFPGGIKYGPIDGGSGLQYDPATKSLTIDRERLERNYEGAGIRLVTAGVTEEVVHQVTTTIVGSKRSRELWAKIPEKLQLRVRTSYFNALANEGKEIPEGDSYAMFHEFLRMLIQDSTFAKEVTESVENNPSMKEWLVEFLRDIGAALRGIMNEKDFNPELRAEILALEERSIQTLRDLTDVDGNVPMEASFKGTDPVIPDIVTPPEGGDYKSEWKKRSEVLEGKTVTFVVRDPLYPPLGTTAVITHVSIDDFTGDVSVEIETAEGFESFPGHVFEVDGKRLSNPITTRKGMSLKRAEIANQRDRGDYLLSIHANSRDKASGNANLVFSGTAKLKEQEKKKTKKEINELREEKEGELLQAKLETLTPATIGALESGASLDDVAQRPILTELLTRKTYTRKDGRVVSYWGGSLMSKGRAEKQGKNVNEFNDMPEGLPWNIWGGETMPDQAAQAAGFDSVSEFWQALDREIQSFREISAATEEAEQTIREMEREAKAEAKAWAEGLVGDSLNQSERVADVDADYLAAVESGDMEAAQAMVDQAAKAAGYGARLFHGSASKFSEAKVPMFLGHTRVVAEAYATDRAAGVGTGHKGLIYDFYAKLKRTASENDVIDIAREELGYYAENDLAFSLLDPLISSELVSGNTIKALEARGFDSAEIDDFTPLSDFDTIKSIVVFDPNQIKSADPVTYDSNGAVIPLSKRFDESSDSILNQSERIAPQQSEATPEELRKANSQIKTLTRKREVNTLTPREEKMLAEAEKVVGQQFLPLDDPQLPLSDLEQGSESDDLTARQSAPLIGTDQGEQEDLFGQGLLLQSERVAAGKKLQAIHNLSPENLKFADEMGGIPSPSIAIVREGQALDGFGDISLLAPREMIDKGRAQIFDSDAWTPRFPEMLWKPVKTSDADALYKQLIDVANKFGERPYELFDWLVNSPDKSKVEQDFNYKNYAKALFLQETTGEVVNPVHIPFGEYIGNHSGGEWVMDKQFREDIKGIDWNNVRDGNEHQQNATKALRAAIARRVENTPKDIRDYMAETYENNWFGEDGLISFRSANSIQNTLRKFKTSKKDKPVDSRKSRERIERKMKGKEDAFQEWMEKKLEIFPDPHMKLRGRNVSYTLENIHDSMISQKQAGSEKSLTFGAGKARAVSAKKYRSVDAAREDIEKLVGKGEMEDFVKNKQEPILEEYRQNITKYYKWNSSWEALDDSMRVLADIAKGMSPRSAAIRHDFKDVPDQVLAEASDAARVIKGAPSEYFEAKVQDIVKLGEFDAAVVPRKAKSAIAPYADKYGWTVRYYNPSKGGDQQRAIKSASKAESDVLFQSERIAEPENTPLLEAARVADAAINKLPPKPKAIINSFAEGKSFAQIGKEQGITAAKAEQVYKNATTIVRKKVERDGPEVGDDDVTDSTLNQSERIAPDVEPFYSQLERLIETKMGGSGSPAQIMGMIDPSKGSGVKAEEIKWTGIEEALTSIADENNGKVPKEALLTYLRDSGRVKFEDDSQTETKYAEYTLPGGENYREVVLTMPEVENIGTGEKVRISRVGRAGLEDEMFGVFGQNGETLGVGNTEQEAMSDAERSLLLERESTIKQNYRSSHFDNVPNYVAHMRTNEREDSEGKTGLFIEEIQSDRHQEGRKKGYAPNPERIDELRIRKQEIEDKGKGATPSEKQEWADVMNELTGDVADAPFRKDWHMQMFKRALRDAVESGKDWIGWTSGETQNDRFDLSKKVDQLNYAGSIKEGWTLQLIKGGEIVGETEIGDAKLEDNAGKEVADRIRKGVGRIGNGMGELRGLDLKVGGEGMKGFYDKMLPSAVQKYVNKWGAKVENTGLYGAKTYRLRRVEDGAFYENADETVVNTSLEDAKNLQSNSDEAWEIVPNDGDQNASTPIWRVNITPEMKESVIGRGQPLFQSERISESEEERQTIEDLQVEIQKKMPSQDAIAAAREQALSDKPGERTGHAYLASLGEEDRHRREHDAVRIAQREAQFKETFEDWDRQAMELVENDRQGLIRHLLELNEAGQAIGDPVHVRAFMILLPDMYADAIASRDPKRLREVQSLSYAFDTGGTVEARALTARRNLFHTRKDRHLDFLSKSFNRPNASVREAMEKAPSPAEKSRQIDKLNRMIKEKSSRVGAQSVEVKYLTEELANVKKKQDKDEILYKGMEAKMEKVEYELESMGISLVEIFNHDGVQRLRSSNIIKKELKKFNKKEREVILLIMGGFTDRQIARQTGVTRGSVAGIEDRFDVGLNKRFRELANLGYTIKDFKDDGTANEALNSPERLPLSAKKLDAILEGFGRGTKPTPEMRNSGRMKRIKTESGEQRFDPDNRIHVAQAARAMAAADSNIIDMVFEYWITGILSGPQTHVVNVGGSVLNMAFEYGAQRWMEAAVNAIPGMRSPGGATLGEFKWMRKAMPNAMAKALEHARETWNTEESMFEANFLNQSIGGGLTKEETGRHAIGENPFTQVLGRKVGAPIDKAAGKLGKFNPFRGRVTRMSTRALNFTDVFFKNLIGHIEAAAQAYRLAKSEGYKGADMEWRMTGLLENMGSAAYIAAAPKAQQLTYTEPLRSSKEGGGAIEVTVKKVQESRSRRDDKLSSVISTFMIGLNFPFIRTPFNIFRQGLKRTPVFGTAPVAMRMLKAGLFTLRDGKPFFDSDGYTKEAFASDVVNQTVAFVGTAIIWGLAEGDDDDDEKWLLITGSRPWGIETDGQRTLLDRTRGGSFQVLLNGKPILDYGRLEPFATTIGTVVDAIAGIKRVQHGKGAIDEMSNIFSYMLNQAKEKTFLQGFASLTEWLENPEYKAKRVPKSILQGLVPNFFRQPLRNMDDYVRDTRNASFAYNALPIGALAPRKIDANGNPIMKGSFLGIDSPYVRIIADVGLKPYAVKTLGDDALLNFNRENPTDQYAPSKNTMDTWKDKRGNTHKMTGAEIEELNIRGGKLYARDVRREVSLYEAEHPTDKTRDKIQSIRRRSFANARKDMIKKGILRVRNL